jgi:hypothetical protein
LSHSKLTSSSAIYPLCEDLPRPCSRNQRCRRPKWQRPRRRRWCLMVEVSDRRRRLRTQSRFHNFLQGPGCNIQGLLYIFFFLGGLFVKCTDRFD